MRKIVWVLMMAPLGLLAQKKAPVKKPVASANKPAKPTTAKPVVAAPVDGFVIEGNVTGYPDGTSVALLNGQTGAPEVESTVQGNHFRMVGKMAAPDFRILLFDRKQPYVTLFLDNSAVKVTGDKATIDQSVVTGSPAHNDFAAFNNTLAPYQAVFAEGGVPDPAQVAKATEALKDFVQSHTTSFIAPLAIYRFNLLNEDAPATEQLFNLLSPPVKASGMGAFVAKQIEDGKRNAIGSVMPDFSQADTTGKMVNLSSLRGKYVLIDFWASWCRPCRQENPNVVANFNQFKDKNFTVLGVSLDKAKQAWVDAINMDGLTWQHVSDLQGWGNQVAKTFKIESIPQNFLIDPDGKIIAKNLRGPALERKLSQLLNK